MISRSGSAPSHVVSYRHGNRILHQCMQCSTRGSNGRNNYWVSHRPSQRTAVEPVQRELSSRVAKQGAENITQSPRSRGRYYGTTRPKDNSASIFGRCIFGRGFGRCATMQRETGYRNGAEQGRLHIASTCCWTTSRSNHRIPWYSQYEHLR